MRKEEYEFYNIPRKYSSQDYKDAVNYIIRKYSKIKGLVSIYGWGGKPNYGISDLDFVFVFDMGKAAPMPVFKRVFYILNGRFRYIARHPFFYIDEESFSNIGYVYPDAQFRLLYGKNLKIRKISSEEHDFSRIALLSDIIVRHYPRDFIEQAVVKSVNARDMLLRLNSLKRSIKTVEILTKEKSAKWSYMAKQVENLRINWFRKSDYGLLSSLNEQAINITMELAEKFSGFLAKKGIVNIISGTNAEYSGTKNSTLFIKDWDKETAIKGMFKLIRSSKPFHSILPIELVPQQIEYSKTNGSVGNYIKDNLRHNLKYKLKHHDIIRKRSIIFNRQAELASKLKHSDFAAFFDFGYRNKAGINNLMLNLLRRYRN